nr:hypothetical protein [Calditrichia bacterium]
MKWNWYLLLIVLMMCLGNGLRAHGETEMLRFGETVQLSSSLAPVAGTTDAPAVQAVFPASNISREAFSRVLVNGLASHLAWDLEIRVGESQGEWSDWEKA